MGFFLVMKAELVRTFIIMRRYWFRTIIGMIIGYATLLALIVGFMHRGQDVGDMAAKLADAETATNWALGFIVGMFAFGIVGMFTQNLQEMAQSGQLEQLCMSPHGLITNFMARSLVGSVMTILTQAIMVYALAKSVGGTLHADFVPTVVLLTLMFLNLIGFGFMVGGLVLVFKQTGQVATILRLVLFGLALLASDKINSYPFYVYVPLHILPITDATISLKYVLIQGQMKVAADGTSVFQSVFVHPSFYITAASCVFWALAGVFCFKVMENWSRSKGTLGAY